MLKNRSTNEELLVIVFTLLPKDGQEKAQAEAEGKEDDKKAGEAADDDLD